MQAHLFVIHDLLSGVKDKHVGIHGRDDRSILICQRMISAEKRHGIHSVNLAKRIHQCRSCQNLPDRFQLFIIGGKKNRQRSVLKRCSGHGKILNRCNAPDIPGRSRQLLQHIVCHLLRRKVSLRLAVFHQIRKCVERGQILIQVVKQQTAVFLLLPGTAGHSGQKHKRKQNSPKSMKKQAVNNLLLLPV